MYRRSNALLTLCLAAAISAVAAGADSRAARDADLEVDAYLDSHNLLSLRVAHLERLLSKAQESEVGELSGRLARAYARLMETDIDDAQRLEFERRSEELLEQAPQAHTLDLRLAMARSRYARAEQAVEKRRLRLAHQPPIAEARTAFRELSATFKELASAADDRVRALDRQLEAGAPRDELMMQAIGESRRARSLAHYLGGWATYYHAELELERAGESEADGSAALAEQAQVRFGALLNGRSNTPPTRDRVPPDMLRYEHIARAALGVGLCWSIRGNLDESLHWLELVESAPDVEPAVRSQIPTRRFIVLARAGAWGRLASYANSLFESEEEGSASSPPLDAPGARLLAVLALESASSASEADANARRLIARRALGGLLRHGESANAIDLIDSYLDLIQADEKGANLFVPRYLRALREYEGARTAHQESARSAAAANVPARDSGVRRRYELAGRLFAGALSAGDAPDFAALHPQVHLLAALAAFFAAHTPDQLDAASAALASASLLLDEPDDEKASAAMRLAIRALELGEQAAPSAARAQRREQLIDAYIEARPEDDAAAAFAFERATAEQAPTAQSIEELLQVEGGPSLRWAARHEAARLMYQVYVDARGDQRREAARTFLDLSLVLLQSDRQRIVTEEENVAPRALMNARRTLDCALSLVPPDRAAAEAAFDLFALLVLRGYDLDEKLRAEYHFRAVQVALLGGNTVLADQEAQKLKELKSPLLASAEAEMYRFALESWQGNRTVEGARGVVQHGRSVLARLMPSEGESTATGGAGGASLVAVCAGVAQASAYLWSETGESEARERALAFFRTGLRADPRNRALLEGSAVFFEQVGEHAAALESWRMLLAGAAPGSDPWFTAKVRVVSLLSVLQPERAREVLEQHRALYPEMGPEPWGEQLQALEAKLPPAPAPTQGGGT